MEKKWMSIEIRYNDGSVFYVSREEIERIDKVSEVILALSEAKRMKDKLNEMLV